MGGASLQLRVRTFNSTESILRINPSAGHIAAMVPLSEVECVHGERRLIVNCVVDRSLPMNSIYMSRRAANQLQLTEYDWDMPVDLSNGRIRFGPLIGILANPQWDKEQRTLKKSKQLASLRKLVEAGTQFGAVCFLFNISGLDLKQGTVRGYILKDDRWHRRVLPLPDVIYDQLVSRKLERDPSIQDKREALSRHYGQKFFNDGFFDKWQIYEWLKDEREVKAHIPHTARHTTTEAALSFLNQHPVVFLKPLHGSLGLGIARFVKHRDGTITYELKQKTSVVTRGKAKSARAVLQVFRTRLKARPYIWQEGLPLARFKDRPLDIRILMQRDHTGDWKRTKMFARVAKPGDFTSNLTSGGDAMPVDAALAELLPKLEQRNRAKAQIRRLSRQVVDAVEKQSGRVFGELGIDLGLDMTGKAWLIEVNSKPRKAPSTEKGRQDLVDLSFERPIRYAIYLATSKSQ